MYEVIFSEKESQNTGVSIFRVGISSMASDFCSFGPTSVARQVTEPKRIQYLSDLRSIKEGLLTIGYWVELLQLRVSHEKARNCI